MAASSGYVGNLPHQQMALHINHSRETTESQVSASPARGKEGGKS